MQFLRKSILVGLLAFSVAAAALAQDDVSITDGRVNENQLLGGVGIFCEDRNGVVSTDYTNGGISVWGPEGDKYLFASAADIALAQTQFPLVNQTVDQVQQSAQNATTQVAQGRTASFDTLRIGNQTTGLLAAAETQRGLYNLYASGGETFYLLGQDEYGRQFLYRWIGCSNADSELSSFGFPLVSSSVRPAATTAPSVTSTPAPATDATEPDVTPTSTGA